MKYLKQFFNTCEVLVVFLCYVHTLEKNCSDNLQLLLGTVGIKAGMLSNVLFTQRTITYQVLTWKLYWWCKRRLQEWAMGWWTKEIPSKQKEQQTEQSTSFVKCSRLWWVTRHQLQWTEKYFGCLLQKYCIQTGKK